MQSKGIIHSTRASYNLTRYPTIKRSLVGYYRCLKLGGGLELPST